MDKEKLRQLIISAWKDGNMQYNPKKGSIDYDADIEMFFESFQYKIDELCSGECLDEKKKLHKHIVSHSATQIKNTLSVKLMNIARKHIGKKPQDVPDMMEILNAIDVIEKHCG